MDKIPVPSAEMIDSLLDQAEGDKLVGVIAFIDKVRHSVDIEEKVDRIRPKLALLRPPRPMTFARVVVVPFEDMLIPQDQWRPESGCIARSHVGPILDCARAAFSADELKAFEKAMAGKQMSDVAAYCVFGQQIWPRVADALNEFVDRPRGRISHLVKLQHRRAAAICAIAELVCPLSESLPPRPMGELSEFQKRDVIDMLSACESLAAASFEAAMQWLVARSFKPSVILDLVLQGYAGTRTNERDDIVHGIALQTLARQRLVLETLAQDPRPIAEVIGDLEQAAGTLLSIKDRARALRLARQKLMEVETVLHKTMLDTIEGAIRREYFDAIEKLDDPEISDPKVHRIEQMARAIKRLVSLAKPCGVEHLTEVSLRETGLDAGEMLVARYATGAEAMVLVDQMRIYELIFGAVSARTLWREFNTTQATMGTVTPTPEPSISPAKTMIAALYSDP